MHTFRSSLDLRRSGRRCVSPLVACDPIVPQQVRKENNDFFGKVTVTKGHVQGDFLTGWSSDHMGY